MFFRPLTERNVTKTLRPLIWKVELDSLTDMRLR